MCSVCADFYKLWCSSLRETDKLNQGWTVAFDVTHATRTRRTFVSSSPIFAVAPQKFPARFNHFAPLASAPLANSRQTRAARIPLQLNSSANLRALCTQRDLSDPNCTDQSALAQISPVSRSPNCMSPNVSKLPVTSHESPVTAPIPNLTYISTHHPCYAFPVAPSFKGANHGMDRTEARRD